jgi:hypothetical protein
MAMMERREIAEKERRLFWGMLRVRDGLEHGEGRVRVLAKSNQCVLLVPRGVFIGRETLHGKAPNGHKDVGIGLASHCGGVGVLREARAEEDEVMLHRRDGNGFEDA